MRVCCCRAAPGSQGQQAQGTHRGNGGAIVAMAVTPSEDTLGLLTQDCRMLTYNLGSVDATNVCRLPLPALLSQACAWHACSCFVREAGRKQCAGKGTQIVRCGQLHQLWGHVQIDVAPLMPAAPACHSGEVVGLAACVRKPLLATISNDQTVRLWNFRDKCALLPPQLLTSRLSTVIALCKSWLLVVVSSSSMATAPWADP